MPERSGIFQGVQIGPEVTPGTAVAADTKLLSIGIDPGINADNEVYRPDGQKWTALVIPGREWSEGDMDGKLAYDEIVYPLCSVIKSVTPTVVGVTGQQWLFEPANSAVDVPQTYTIEVGDAATRAHRIVNGIFPDFTLDVSRQACNVTGRVIGKRIEDAIVLTAAPTSVPLIPVLPSHFSIYLDATAGALGTTKLLRALRAQFRLTNRHGMLWAINSSESSFAATLEAEPRAEFRFLVEADAAGMGPLTQLRSGDTRFIRLAAVGPVIGAGPATYETEVNVAIKLKEASRFEDQDGVYAVEWTSELVYDSGWTKPMSIRVVNSVAAL